MPTLIRLQSMLSPQSYLSRKLIDGDKALREGRLTSPGASLPGLVREYNLGGNELPGKCLGIVGLGKSEAYCRKGQRSSKNGGNSLRSIPKRSSRGSKDC